MNRLKSTNHSRFLTGIFALIWGISFLFSGGHSYSIDEETYLANLRALLRGSRTIPKLSGIGHSYVTVPDKMGVATSFYGIGTSVFNFPGYVIGKALSFIVSSEWRELMFRIFYFGTNSVALAATGTILGRICLQLGSTRRFATYLAIAYSTGTYALAHSKTGFAEPLTAMFIVLSVSLLLDIRIPRAFHTSAQFGIGCCLGFAVMMRASAILFVPAFLIAVVWRSRTIRSVSIVVSGLAIPAIVVMLNNWWRFGSISDTGYPPLKYDTPVLEGIFGLLASPGKGLFFFAPLALYAVSKVFRAWAIDRELTLIVVWGLLSNIWLFSRFEIWSGDNAYGPRYMGIVLPLMLVLLCVVGKELRPRNIILPWLVGLTLTLGGAFTYFNAVYYKYVPDLIAYTGESAKSPDGSINWTEIRQTVNFVPRYSQIYTHSESIDDSLGNFVSSLRADKKIQIFEGGIAGQLSWYSAETRLDTWWATWVVVGAPKWVLALVLAPLCSVLWGLRTIRETLKLEV